MLQTGENNVASRDVVRRGVCVGGGVSPPHSSLVGLSAFPQISSAIHPWKKNLKRRGKTGENIQGREVQKYIFHYWHEDSTVGALL